MLSRILLLILLVVFFGCSVAMATDTDAIYMNTTNTDMQINTANEFHVPTFILIRTLLNKNVSIYIWVDNVKDAKNIIIASKYLSEKGDWVDSMFNQLQPSINKFNSFSPYYNLTMTYKSVRGAASFVLNVCVRENKSSILNFPPNIITIRAASICGSRGIRVAV